MHTGGVQLNTWRNAEGIMVEGGFTVEVPQQKDVKLFIRFYEWNMFGAMQRGQHTHGNEDFEWVVREDGKEVRTCGDGIDFRAIALQDGAELSLQVTNETDFDWTSPAGIIPCFSPGDGKSVKASTLFTDSDRTRTYYMSKSGLALLEKREIHFNDQLRTKIDQLADHGEFVFSDKWPTSDHHATSGIMMRESTDRRWIAAIAWDEFLSAQGHNPWNCMHLGVHIGTLKRGQSRKFRGRIYLFEGTKEACLERYLRDFQAVKPE